MLRFILPMLMSLACLPAMSAPLPTLQLLNYESPHHHQLSLTSDDWQWLRNKRELVLGTAQQNLPPLEMVNETKEYEGVTADYIGLLADALGVKISVRAYDTREQVFNALARGEIDLMGSVTQDEARPRQLLLSQSYLVNRPTLVARLGDSPSLKGGLQGRRLAISQDTISLPVAQAMYPLARIETYGSADAAMAAVAFGDADVLLSDAVSAQFLISRNYSDYLRIIYSGPASISGFAFAVSPDNRQLQHSLDAALRAIHKEQDISIRNRWGDRLLLSMEKTSLTPEEQRWIEKNPVVRIGIHRYLPPMSYFDADGNYLGITADLLAMLEAKTGLTFEITPLPSFKDLNDAVHEGRVQMVADRSRTPERETYLQFTRPYLVGPYMLITRDAADAPKSLEDMAGKTLLIGSGHALVALLRQRYPQIRIKEVQTNFEALSLLRDHKADAAVQAEIAVSFNLPRIKADQLKVRSALNLPLLNESFAVRRDQLELFSIIDKSLRSISPDAITELNNRWRSKAAVAPPSWRDYRTTLYLAGAASIVLLLIALAWGYAMRRQVSQRERAEHALNDQLRFMDALINGTPNPIYVRDRDRRLVICNDSYLKTMGTDRQSVLGSNLEQLAVPEAGLFATDFQSILDGGPPLLIDRTVHIRGQQMQIYHWMLPYRDAQGEILGIIGGWLDISERQQLLNELTQAKNDADKANRAKTTFLATMSHEIRTPHECGDRHARTGPQARRPGSARPPFNRGGLQLGPGSAGTDRRHPRHRADRKRAPEPEPRAGQSAGSGGIGVPGLRWPGPAKGPAPGTGPGQQRQRRRAGRPAALQADPLEPGEQRHQVHRAWQRADPPAGRARRPADPAPATDGAGHRHRHRTRGPAAAVPALQPGPRTTPERPFGDRAGAGDLPHPVRNDGRPVEPAKPAWGSAPLARVQLQLSRLEPCRIHRRRWCRTACRRPLGRRCTSWWWTTARPTANCSASNCAFSTTR